MASLLALFNRIWRESFLLEAWEMSTALPLCKPGRNHSTLIIDFCPVILTCICKLLDKMVNVRLVYLLKQDDHLSPQWLLLLTLHVGHFFPIGGWCLQYLLQAAFRYNIFSILRKLIILSRVHDHGPISHMRVKGRLPQFLGNNYYRSGRTFYVSMPREEGIQQRSVLSIILHNGYHWHHFDAFALYVAYLVRKQLFNIFWQRFSTYLRSSVACSGYCASFLFG